MIIVDLTVLLPVARTQRRPALDRSTRRADEASPRIDFRSQQEAEALPQFDMRCSLLSLRSALNAYHKWRMTVAPRVSIDDFKADPHGARYIDVLRDPLDGRAFRAALRVLNDPRAIVRMVDTVDRFHRAALIGTVREIEAEPHFIAACRGRKRATLRRLKQAVGVACKLIMATEGYVPKDRSDGSPDQGRLESFATWFTTARKYRRR